MKCYKCGNKAQHKIISPMYDGKVIRWFCDDCLKLNELMIVKEVKG